MGEWQDEKNGINGRVTGWEKWDEWECQAEKRVINWRVTGWEKSDELESARLGTKVWMGECQAEKIVRNGRML